MNIEPQHNKLSVRKTALDTNLIINVTSQVAMALIGIILIALFIGVGIDELLGNEQHPFTILLFLGSVPVSLIVTFMLAKRATKSLNTQDVTGKQVTPVKEEEKRG